MFPLSLNILLQKDERSVHKNEVYSYRKKMAKNAIFFVMSLFLSYIFNLSISEYIM